MELGGEIVWLGGRLVNLTLKTKATRMVNGFPSAYTIANIPVLLATIATNAWAFHIIRKENSRINRSSWRKL